MVTGNKRPRRGRPQTQGLVRRLSVDIDGRLHDQLTTQADALGKTVRAEVEAALREYLGRVSTDGMIHGVSCPKAPHTRSGYLHDADDDGPYDVDGLTYCGRCHGSP